MTEIRAKDKIFLLVAIPAALAGAYFYFWRQDAAKELSRLETRCEALVEEEDFPAEMRRAEKRLSEAGAALEAEKAKPAPAVKVKASPLSGDAERESAVLRIFAACGLSVTRSEIVYGGGAGDRGPLPDAETAQRDALAATRLLPSPVLRRYTLDGAYPAVRRALSMFVAEEAAVVPATVEMKPSGTGRWSLTLWL